MRFLTTVAILATFSVVLADVRPPSTFVSKETICFQHYTLYGSRI